MTSKKWIKLLIILFCSCVVFVCGVNYIVDPFHQYRIKTFYPISYTNERYKNAGFSKNFNYDSIILGTSMTENFLLEETKNIGFKNTLKLSISGGSAREQSITLTTAINNNENLRYVIWGLDNFSFIGDYNRLRFGKGSFPYHLYDNNIFNDNEYLLSFDTLLKSINIIINPKKNLLKTPELFNYNKMYQWQHKEEFSFTPKKLYQSWIERKDYANYEKNKQGFSYLKNSFDKNFANVFSNKMPIKYYIFFPPYSMLYFKHLEIEGQLEDLLQFKEYLFSILIKYPNIQIYDFQIAKNITHNLNNYKDITHYHQRINTWMLEQIKLNNYLVTSENMEQKVKNLKNQIKEYDLTKTINMIK